MSVNMCSILECKWKSCAAFKEQPSPFAPCLCQLKQSGTMCRGPAGACDLPEYCTGASPYCPSNVYLLDGSSCQYGVAYCYTGMCLTHQQQCLQLWGYGENSQLPHSTDPPTQLYRDIHPS